MLLFRSFVHVLHGLDLKWRHPGLFIKNKLIHSFPSTCSVVNWGFRRRKFLSAINAFLHISFCFIYLLLNHLFIETLLFLSLLIQNFFGKETIKVVGIIVFLFNLETADRALLFWFIEQILIAIDASLILDIILLIAIFAYNWGRGFLFHLLRNLHESYFTHLTVGNKFWIFKSARRTQVFGCLFLDFGFSFPDHADRAGKNVFAYFWRAIFTDPGAIHASEYFIKLVLLPYKRIFQTTISDSRLIRNLILYLFTISFFWILYFDVLMKGEWLFFDKCTNIRKLSLSWCYRSHHE